MYKKKITPFQSFFLFSFFLNPKLHTFVSETHSLSSEGLGEPSTTGGGTFFFFFITVAFDTRGSFLAVVCLFKTQQLELWPRSNKPRHGDESNRVYVEI